MFNLYQEAFVDGYEKVRYLHRPLTWINYEKLLEIKGIGKVKAEAIINIIKEFVEKRNCDEEIKFRAFIEYGIKRI